MHVPSVVELRSLLEERGLERRIPSILQRALPAVGFYAARRNPSGIGETRLGGSPDLPPGCPWPARDGRPLGFVAQVSMAQMAPLVDVAVPGLLSFFYDMHEMPWGFDPADRDGWRVLHFHDTASLAPVPPPAGADGVLPCRLEAVPRVTLPPLERLHDLELTEAEEEAYWELDVNGGHQFLGHPCQIQGDMAPECEMASTGHYCGDGVVPGEEPSGDDWRLLLQVDSDDEAGTMWGDVGFIYYWIRRQDLHRGDFSRVWLVLQCH